MTGERRRRVILGILAADLLVFGGWIASLQIGRLGSTVKLPIQGLDPRDLLSGHYIAFTLAAEREAQAFLPADSRDPGGQAVDFCLERRDDRLHVSRLRAPAADCKPFLRGHLDGGRVRFEMNRFYVDERRAHEVSFVQAAPETYLLATINDLGWVQAVDLVVDGKSMGQRK